MCKLISWKCKKVALCWFCHWKKGGSLVCKGVLYVGFNGTSKQLHFFLPQAHYSRAQYSHRTIQKVRFGILNSFWADPFSQKGVVLSGDCVDFLCSSWNTSTDNIHNGYIHTSLQIRWELLYQGKYMYLGILTLFAQYIWSCTEKSSIKQATKKSYKHTKVSLMLPFSHQYTHTCMKIIVGLLQGFLPAVCDSKTTQSCLFQVDSHSLYLLQQCLSSHWW